MRRIIRHRRIGAWFLAVLFMLLIAEKGWHGHDYGRAPEASCAFCEHHAPHAGHLASTWYEGDDCVLCQWLSAPFLPAMVVALAAGCAFCCIMREGICPNRPPRHADGFFLRGPPPTLF